MSKIELLKWDIESEATFISSAVHQLAEKEPTLGARALALGIDTYLLERQKAQEKTIAA